MLLVTVLPLEGSVTDTPVLVMSSIQCYNYCDILNSIAVYITEMLAVTIATMGLK